MIEGDGGRGAGVEERDSMSDTLCRIYDPDKGLPNNKAPVNVTLWVFVILVFWGSFVSLIIVITFPYRAWTMCTLQVVFLTSQ